jgi:hypothetical protein
MNSETSKLLDHLQQIVARYDKWHQPLVEHFATNMTKMNKEGITPQKLELLMRSQRDLEASLKAKYDPYPEIYSLFERLCAAYLGCDSTGRMKIRDFVAARKTPRTLLWMYVGELSKQIKCGDDVDQLTLGLAAVSIENCGSDYRDTLTTLADLYVRAEEVGIDPRPIFDAVADLSTDSPTPGGCDALSTTLREFESHAVLQERRGMQRPYRDAKW